MNYNLSQKSIYSCISSNVKLLIQFLGFNSYYNSSISKDSYIREIQKGVSYLDLIKESVKNNSKSNFKVGMNKFSSCHHCKMLFKTKTMFCCTFKYYAQANQSNPANFGRSKGILTKTRSISVESSKTMDFHYTQKGYSILKRKPVSLYKKILCLLFKTQL